MLCCMQQLAVAALLRPPVFVASLAQIATNGKLLFCTRQYKLGEAGGEASCMAVNPAADTIAVATRDNRLHVSILRVCYHLQFT